MAAIGHHQSEKMRAEEALEIARDSTAADVERSRFVDTHGVSAGDRVTIMPTDYALDPVEGELLISTESEFAVRRTDPQASSVVVHFPRIGFQLKKL
jgi:hypothetical protein